MKIKVVIKSSGITFQMGKVSLIIGTNLAIKLLIHI